MVERQGELQSGAGPTLSLAIRGNFEKEPPAEESQPPKTPVQAAQVEFLQTEPLLTVFYAAVDWYFPTRPSW